MFRKLLRSVAVLVVPLAISVASTSSAQSTLDVVKKRGTLNCGVNGQLRGFSWHGGPIGWTGFDVDLCKAVAAATLGDATRVTYTPLTAQQRFKELADGRVDLLARNSTVMLQRLADGVEAVSVNFYDGQAFVVPNKLAIQNLSQMSGGKVCTVRGTTHGDNATAWFRARRSRIDLVSFDTNDAMLDAFFASRCLAATLDASALASTLVVRNEAAGYSILPQMISREPLGPYVRRGDEQWANIVRWTVQATLAAEDLDLRRDNVQSERRSNDPDVRHLLGVTPGNGKALGLDEDWAFNIILQVGNYGESFERNLGTRSMLKLARGQNALWRDGGLMYPLPMR